MAERLRFGAVDAPEGVIVIVDHGLTQHWWRSREASDLQIVGDDAMQAGRAYDREFDPNYLFDRPNPEDAKQHFDEFATERGLDAHAEILDEQLSRQRRVLSAVAAGDGLGVVKYDGLWGVVVGGVPTNRPIDVFADVIPEGEFAGRLQRIVLEVAPQRAVANSDEVAGIMVDHGQFLFAGLGAMEDFEGGKSRDGLCDFVFWGRDAQQLAGTTDARRIGDDLFGWQDLPSDDIGARATLIQNGIKAGAVAACDYRPHCNRERANALMRESEHDATELEVSGHRVVACANRWGDGMFEVARDRDDDGNLVRIRLELATDQRLELMRRVAVRHSGAIVSRAVLDAGEPINVAERSDPSRPSDSGWYFGSGGESEAFLADAKNFAVCRVDTVLERHPELEPILLEEPGCFFFREGDVFVRGED